jgi:hypothetical protein
MAFVTNDQDETNPLMWSERGTEGNLAPEQIYWTDDITKEARTVCLNATLLMRPP